MDHHAHIRAWIKTQRSLRSDKNAAAMHRVTQPTTDLTVLEPGVPVLAASLLQRRVLMSKGFVEARGCVEEADTS